MSKNFFSLLKNSRPLKIVGTVNAYSALLAQKSGLEALYISGAAVSYTHLTLPTICSV